MTVSALTGPRAVDLTGPKAKRGQDNGANPNTGAMLPDRVPPLPTGPGLLEHTISQVLNPHPDMPTVEALDDGARPFARIVLARTQPLCEPAPRAVLLAWLWPIADAVEYPPTEDEFFRRLAALELVAADIPCVAWNKESQREGLRIWKRFPSVAAIVQLVQPGIEPLLARRDALAFLLTGDVRPLQAIETGAKAG